MHPDTEKAIWELIAHLEVNQRSTQHTSQRLNWALQIGDYLGPAAAPIPVTHIVEHIVTFLIPNEPDIGVRNELFGAIERASIRNQFVEVSLSPLIDEDFDKDPALTCGILNLTGKMPSDSYIPYVRARIEHSNEFVRKCAQTVWMHWYKDRAEKLGL